jgi:4-amino-4-deoxy-L-arabinose transferase-like glycosyltransferase
VIDLIDRKFVLKYQAEILLAGILALSAFLNIWNIWNQGFTNTYYAAAVKSMLVNPRIAFFNPFDPAGFVTVDKPPVGIWIQAAFATVLGFSGWVLIFPQALAGVGAVAFIYFIVAHPFGKQAGLIAALTLAVTPILVAVSRNGTMDAQLIFVLLLAVWVALKATRERSLPWFLVSVILIGIGFNIKMIQAFVVIPAVFAVYFLGRTDFTFRKRVLHLGIAVIVLLAVSLSWAVAVDMVPASQRPYIGGSGDNTVLGLIANYNGLERLETSEMSIMGDDAGTPGITRFFGEQLAGQFSWLIPLALIGLLAWVRKPVSLTIKGFENSGIASERGLTVIAMLLWLVPGLLFFSFTTAFGHIYYIATIAPPLAGLVGIGAVAMYREYLTEGWKGWILVGAVLITGLLQVLFLSYDAAWSGLLITLVLIGSAGCAGILAYLRIRKNAVSQNCLKYFVIIALALLFIAPFVWSCTPLMSGGGNILPIAGPQVARWGGGAGSGTSAELNRRNISAGVGPDLGDASSNQLAGYLLTHTANETWVLAVPSSNPWANPWANLIIETGKPVMALGGFLGSDRILNVTSLTALIKENKVRYFLPWSIGGPAGRTNSGSSEIFRWVSAHCTALNVYNGNETVVNWTSPATSIYNCAGAAGSG